MYVSANSGLTLPPQTPVASSWFNSSNRINSWTYDNNGNVLSVAAMNRNFTYDAENRQVSAAINSSSASYVYDGLGQRVQKTVNGATTTYVYDAFGNLASEYGPSEPSPCGSNTPCYVSVDHLGSTRMLMDSTGAVQRRYDYLPFGGELLAGTDGRMTSMQYLSALDPNDVSPKFTSQTREPETVMDWFNVRDYDPAQGRFQSVDPGNAGADPSDPQTWNMYAYVTNNPLSYTDPSGMGFWSDFFGILAGFATFFTTGDPIAGIETGLAVAIGGTIGGALGLGGGSSIGGVGGGVNTGDVFGSGDAGPFVNNILLADATLRSQNFNLYTDAIGFLMSDPRMAAIIFQLQKSRHTYVVLTCPQ